MKKLPLALFGLTAFAANVAFACDDAKEVTASKDPKAPAVAAKAVKKDKKATKEEATLVSAVKK